MRLRNEPIWRPYLSPAEQKALDREKASYDQALGFLEARRAAVMKFERLARSRMTAVKEAAE